MTVGDHNALILKVAGKRLTRIGLQQKGRSRIWLDDHGWWLIVVEFQPSNWSRGTYCYIGVSHLWFERDYLVFGEPERVRDLNGNEFIGFNPEDPEMFGAEIIALCEEVERAVGERRRAYGLSESDSLERLARRRGDIYVDYDAGAAAGLLGWKPEAANAFGRVLAADEHAPWVAHVKEEAAILAALVGSPRDLATELNRRVDRTREALRLEPARPSWSHHEDAG